MNAALYSMRVMHKRHVPPFYRFVYRLFYLLVDIDQIATVAREHRLFSYNRWNLLAFFDRDHGSHEQRRLRPWVEATVARHGVELDGGPIRLLCMPRIFGYVFNPISLYYCHDRRGALVAIVAEVHNTFGEMHSYVLHAGGQAMDLGTEFIRPKRFHVSPFLDVSGEYRFRFESPDASIRVLINEWDNEQAILTATMAGTRHALSDAAIVRWLVSLPLQTLNVVIRIHWQALKLWLRGAGYRSRPLPPDEESTG
ncbi:MAG: DUF1365 domain-containing protein [Pseudomonadota bacterium]|nr:DUF1365 domain-containing protein [Pseudomonadota bacterium]